MVYTQYKKDYNQSIAGKSSKKKYRQTKKGKDTAKRYYISPKGKKTKQKFFQIHIGIKNKYAKKYRQALRLEVLNHYSKGKMECVCCGEKHMEFLSINHMNGGGNKHRKELGINQGGSPFYQWLKKNNYPEGYNVMCDNCNNSLGRYGYCPHQRLIKEAVEQIVEVKE
jgi:hypothetical protein